ncbi:hypothetical protein JTB14_022691 [Gonioctena quinquepunctata]|nr:hypothetical protein JTB14_022691 [Gonioctena quinquepunctata]
MESLLASFRREKSKGTKTLGTGKGQHEVYISKWFAFKSLSFLLDRDEPTQSIHLLEDDRESVPDAKDFDVGNLIAAEVGSLESPHLDVENANTHCGESEPVASKKRKIIPKLQKSGSEDDTEIDNACLMLENRYVKRKNDACYDYAIHIANKLRNYSQRTNAFVQYHFNNILFRADMGQFELTQNSTMPIPTSSPIFSAIPQASTFVSVPLQCTQTPHTLKVDSQDKDLSSNTSTSTLDYTNQ